MMRYHEGDVAGDFSRNWQVVMREVCEIPGKEINPRPQPAAKANRNTHNRFHSGIDGRAVPEEDMRLKVVKNKGVPLLEHFSIWDCAFEVRRCRGYSGPCIKRKALAGLVDFQDAHHVVGQYGLHDLGNVIEHLANVEDIG